VHIGGFHFVHGTFLGVFFPVGGREPVHLLIFVLAGAQAARLDSRWLYLVVLFFYFFFPVGRCGAGRRGVPRPPRSKRDRRATPGSPRGNMSRRRPDAPGPRAVRPAPRDPPTMICVIAVTQREVEMVRTGRMAWLALLAVGAALACRQGPAPAMTAEIERLRTDSAERDRLLQEMAENTRVMSEVSAELSKVRIPAQRLRTTSESPLRASRDSMLARVRYVTSRLNESTARLRESERRINDLSSLSDSLRSTLAATIANYDTLIANQHAEIAAITEQLGALQAENVALRDTVTHMSERENTVYYVVGTRDELIERGIVTPEGGSRFLLIFGKRGQTLAPARELDPSQFTAINKRLVTEIPLPATDDEYRIASRQDLGQLATPPGENGKITGTPALRITQPEQFWTASKFLIVVRG
jgi:hypothetical protein